MPSDKLPQVEDLGKESLRVTTWVKKFSRNDGDWHEFGATAYYREYVQTRRNKGTNKVEPNAMWEKMPINQLTKCAEALALRRGWPEELGQIYVDEELPSQEPVYLPPENAKREKAMREMGTLKVSTEPNRGHGNEGIRRTPEQEICAECRQVNGHTEECKLHPKNTAAAGAGETGASGDKPAAGAGKKSKRDAWIAQPGHDPKIHIAFDEGIQLFEIQRKLNISDEQIKAMLDREFEIQHRYLIRQDQFQQVLDAVQREFGQDNRPE
jgi:hypothetical protein